MEMDDQDALSPAESLRLIEQQRAAAQRQLSEHPMTFYGPWGFAWFVGFGVMFLRFGPDGRIFVNMPEWLPTLLLFILLAAAAVVSGYMSSRAYRHIRGQSPVQGAMYGAAWGIAFVTMGLTLNRFAKLLPQGEHILIWGTISVLLAAVLFVAGAAIWRERVLFGLGIWLALINVIGTAAGPGWHSLIISLLGGGAMLAAGIVLTLRTRRRVR